MITPLLSKCSQVPEFQPNFALNMFKKFIAGEVF